MSTTAKRFFFLFNVFLPINFVVFSLAIITTFCHFAHKLIANKKYFVKIVVRLQDHGDIYCLLSEHVTG